MILGTSYMINKEEFLSLLRDYHLQDSRVDALNAIFPDSFGAPIIDFGWLMFDKVKKAYFTEEGIDWIDWWLYERDDNPEMKAWDEDGDEIPMNTVEDLWRYVKHYRRQWNSPNTQTSPSGRE